MFGGQPDAADQLGWLLGCWQSPGEDVENAEHDYPQRIISSWRTADELQARIAGIVDGQQKRSEWRWTAMACSPE